MRRLLLVGSSQLGEAVLRGLLNACRQRSDIELIGLFPWSFTRAGRDYNDPAEKAMIRLAKQSKVRLLRFTGVNGNDFKTFLSKAQPDILLVACWGEIIKQSHLRAENAYQVINCHPSLLPAHRGPNPYTSVILQNEAESGITFHVMTEEIDGGPIVLQQSVPVMLEDTGESLRARCCETAEVLTTEFLDWVMADPPTAPVPQNESEQSYFPQIHLSDGNVNWSMPPEMVLRRHRAMTPWLYSYAWLEGRWLMTFYGLSSVPLTALPNHVGLQQTGAIQDGKLAKAIEPGMIVAKQLGILWIAGSDPTQVFCLSEYRIYWWFFFLPINLSRAWGEAIARPAMRFVSGAV